MTSKFIIYGLCDPRTGELRYVGKSTSGLARPRKHAMPSSLKRDKGHRANWVRKLRTLQLQPEIVLIEEYPDAVQLSEQEQFFIAYFKSIGCNLTNLTAGGEGAVGYRHSAAAKAAMSALHPGITAAHKAKMTASRVGVKKRPHTAAVKAQIAATKGCQPFMDESGQVFNTLREASRALGVHVANICACLHGRRASTGGHTFTRQTSEQG